MKILNTAWDIFENNSNGYELKRNGGSIMIADICEYIGRLEESFLFIGSENVPKFDYGHIHVLSNERYLPAHRTKEKINEWQSGLKRAFEEYISDIRPDYVLVQGGGDFSTNCMAVCNSMGQGFSFVDHLFQGTSKGVIDHELKKWEDAVFRNQDLNVVAVSTSMRKRILETYPKLKEENIIAIPNGTPFVRRKTARRDFRKELGLKNKKILLCSGTLHPRKNQIQLIEAYRLLDKRLKKNICILLCGNDSKRQPQREFIEGKIRDSGLEKNILYIGALPREDMHDLYASIDGLIMPSLNEGLSLVALEAMVYGKPVIMYADNETAGDVNDPCATVLIQSHSDQALAEGIIKWYGKSWKEEEIVLYSKRFEMQKVAKQYIDYVNKHE